MIRQTIQIAYEPKRIDESTRDYRYRRRKALDDAQESLRTRVGVDWIAGLVWIDRLGMKSGLIREALTWVPSQVVPPAHRPSHPGRRPQIS